MQLKMQEAMAIKMGLAGKSSMAMPGTEALLSQTMIKQKVTETFAAPTEAVSPQIL